MQTIHNRLSQRRVEKVKDGRYVVREGDGTVVLMLVRDAEDKECWTKHRPDGSFLGYMVGSENTVLSLVDPGFVARALAAAGHSQLVSKRPAIRQLG